jgi:hypothetical protein
VTTTDTCFVCAKHRQGAAAQGGVIYEDELVYAGHAHLLGRSETYLGQLMAEPKRHVVGLGALSDDEATALLGPGSVGAVRCGRSGWQGSLSAILMVVHEAW